MPRPLALALASALGACGPGLEPNVDVSAPPPERLSELGLIAWTGRRVVHAREVEPYALNTPLFTDFSLKERHLFLPEGGTMGPGGLANTLDLPVGSALLKTFLFAPDLAAPDEGLFPVETRLLRRTEAGWEAWPYVWDELGEDATLDEVGSVRFIDLLDASGASRTAAHEIPSRQACASCHAMLVEGQGTLTPLGITPRQLHREGQLEAWAEDGLLVGLDPATVEPAADFDATVAQLDRLAHGQIDLAARDYLDVNCAHCHRPGAIQGGFIGLHLNQDHEDDEALGLCRAAMSGGMGTGNPYVIVPGDASASFLVDRMQAEDPGLRMAPLGRSLAHDDGVALIRTWIASMPSRACDDDVQ